MCVTVFDLLRCREFVEHFDLRKDSASQASDFFSHRLGYNLFCSPRLFSSPSFSPPLLSLPPLFLPLSLYFINSTMSMLSTSPSPFSPASLEHAFAAHRPSSCRASSQNPNKPNIPDFRRSQSQSSYLSRSNHSIKFESFSLHFDMPLKAAAEKFGVRATAFKKRCRAIGIRHWPYRKVRSLKRSIQELTRCKENGSITEKQRFQHQTYKRDLDKLMSPETYGIEASRDLGRFFAGIEDDERHATSPYHRQSSSSSSNQNPFAQRQQLSFFQQEQPSAFRSRSATSPGNNQMMQYHRPEYDDITFLNCSITSPPELGHKSSTMLSAFATSTMDTAGMFRKSSESPSPPPCPREHDLSESFAMKAENNQHFHDAFGAPYPSSGSSSSNIPESFPFNDDLGQIDYIGNEKHFLDDIFVELSPIYDYKSSN